MSYTNLLYHIVYSTKGRTPFITKDWRNGDYIRRQEVHHQKASFADELRQLLERHNIPFDETSLLG